MSKFSQRFSSEKQEWETPQKLFDVLNLEYNFTIDLAANENNAKCDNFFSIEDNAMERNWDGTCWLNPPYGDSKYRLDKWVEKAHEESKKDSCIVVMLIPARTNTKWFHKYCMNAFEVKFICGRPKFGFAEHGLPQPLAIVVFKCHDGPTKFSSFFMSDIRKDK